jgi:very-short-patch-repair endonuclease
VASTKKSEAQQLEVPPAASHIGRIYSRLLLCRDKSRCGLDGLHHQLKDQKEYDKNRTEFLEEYGIRTIRILNEEVLSNIENVLEKIITFTNSARRGQL